MRKKITIGEIYPLLKETGAKMDHHASDLYVEKTPDTKKIVEAYENVGAVSQFVDMIDKNLWYEIPFAYTPHFERGAKTC